MKWFFGLVTACLVVVARAQSGLDEQYVQIFNLIQEGDTLRNNAPGQALAKYLEAQTNLQRFQKGNPEWNTKLVGFRLLDLSNKIAALSGSAPASLTPAESAKKPAPSKQVQAPQPADLENQISRLTDQVRQLEAEKVILETKLKEAFAIQPAESDPRELARAEEKIKTLQKENELLKVSIDQQKVKPVRVVDASASDQAQKARLEKEALDNSLRQAAAPPANATPPPQSLAAENGQIKQLERERDDLQKKLDKATRELSSRKGKAPAAGTKELEDQLLVARARIEALETRAAPYSAEELAMFQRPEPKLAVVPPANPGKKSVKELPPGSATLVAEAQTYFAAKQFDQAEGAYLQILKKDENNVPALANLAAIQVEAQHLDAADKNITKALSIDPEDSYSLYVKGLVKLRQAKYDDALDALSHCAKLDPQNPEVQNYLGLALSEKGMRVPAEAALRKAIQLKPSYAGAHYNLAIVYLNQKPPALELARWHYQKAIAAGYSRNSDLEKKFASAQ